MVNGLVSLTPLRLDLTDAEALARLGGPGPCRADEG
jgi:hypothetical protein